MGYRCHFGRWINWQIDQPFKEVLKCQACSQTGTGGAIQIFSDTN